MITLVPTTGESVELAAHNPLGKLPCLVTDDGVALFDSRVICAFLDTVGEGFPMFPTHGMRMRALKLQALSDGICDAAVLRRGEMLRARDPDRDAVMVAQALKVSRALDMLEADLPTGHIDIGTIAVACALGYLDLRYAHEPWREMSHGAKGGPAWQLGMSSCRHIHAWHGPCQAEAANGATPVAAWSVLSLVQELPIRMPVASTSAPPSMTLAIADSGAVSM